MKNKYIYGYLNSNADKLFVFTKYVTSQYEFYSYDIALKWKSETQLLDGDKMPFEAEFHFILYNDIYSFLYYRLYYTANACNYRLPI